MSTAKHSTKAPSDAELHARFLASDKAAANILVQRHYNEILAFFRRRLPNDADDLAQSVFEVYVRNPKKVTGTNLRAYFYGIARFKYFRALRDRTRHPVDEHSLSQLNAMMPGVSTIVGGRVEVQKLLRALQSLRIDYQNLIELILKGFSMRECAEILGRNENTCKTWKRLALDELRGRFGDLRLSLRGALIALHELEMLQKESIREIFGAEETPDELLAEIQAPNE